MMNQPRRSWERAEELMHLPMMQGRALRVYAWALVVLLSGSCSSGPSEPATLRLGVNTTGPSPDPDGYTYSLDGSAAASLASSDVVIVGGLNGGLHELVVGGVASNCTLEGGTTRSIALAEGDTTDVLLHVTCVAIPNPATLRLTTTTTGGDPDVNGYTYALDGASPVAIGANTIVSIGGLAPGSHQLVVGDVASNCSVAGGTTRSVNLTSGAITDVQLAVTCVGTSPTIVATVPLSGGPYGVAVSAAGVIYAAEIASNTLARGDLATRSFTGSVTVGSTPPHVVFNPAGTTAYATLQTGQALAVVDVATNTLTTTVPLTSDGFNLIVAPDGQRVYVTTANGDLFVVDAATNTVVTTLAVGAAANGLAFSPDGTVLYVSSRDAGTVVAVDPATNTITRTYDLGGMPQRLVVAPDGTELYVANEISGLDVVNVASGAVTSTSFGTAGYGLGLTPDGTQLYVLLPEMGELRILNRVTRALVKTLLVGGVPRNVVFASDGTALVANQGAIVFIQ
jgi:YVTN family beta-propeller protein